MKRIVFSSMLLAAASFMSLPLMAQYKMNIQYKDGNTVSHYVSTVKDVVWTEDSVSAGGTEPTDIMMTAGPASKVTCFSARVSARVVPQSAYGKMACGIAYDTIPQPTHKVQAAADSGAFTAVLKGLYGDRIYYYRPYAETDGKTYYGKVSSFRTLPDNMVVTDDMDSEYNIRAKVTLCEGDMTSMKGGMCFSTTHAVPTVADFMLQTDEMEDSFCYSIPLALYGDVYCRSFLMIDGIPHYGNVKKFSRKMQPIDLGLSVKWSPVNLGAVQIIDDGNYYAWGETLPQKKSGWKYYGLCQGSEKTMLKYCTNAAYGTVDGKTRLEHADDAVCYNWGGQWRMPTREEFEELMTKCQWTVFSLNGNKGYKVTGPNGNCIFFPSSGYCYDGSFYLKGSRGYFWTSDLDTDKNSNAHGLLIRVDTPNTYIFSASRYNNYSIRPVCP